MRCQWTNKNNTNTHKLLQLLLLFTPHRHRHPTLFPFYTPCCMSLQLLKKIFSLSQKKSSKVKKPLSATRFKTLAKRAQNTQKRGSFSCCCSCCCGCCCCCRSPWQQQLVAQENSQCENQLRWVQILFLSLCFRGRCLRKKRAKQKGQNGKETRDR